MAPTADRDVRNRPQATYVPTGPVSCAAASGDDQVRTDWMLL